MGRPWLPQISSPSEGAFWGTAIQQVWCLTLNPRCQALSPAVTETVSLKKVEMYIMLSLSGFTNDLLIQKSPLFIELCLPLGPIALETDSG
jgi:hypothetical protein